MLGCKLRFGDESRPETLHGAARRRALRAAGEYLHSPSEFIVASGGRTWAGVVEADALAAVLGAEGVPAAAIVRERCSHSTRDNARYVAELLARRAVREIRLVTCDFHMNRARFLFEAEGFAVEPVEAPSPARNDDALRTRLGAALDRSRERLATFFDSRLTARRLARFPGAFGSLVALAFVVAANTGCRSRAPTANDAGAPVATTAPTIDVKRIERAEDTRDAKDLAQLLGQGAPLSTPARARVARALARIADDESAGLSLSLLSDEDDTVVAWAAYGLGYSCKGHEEAHVRALVARGLTWAAAAGNARPARIDPAFAIPRAVGRCATQTGERTLAEWVKARGPFARAAAYALGDLVTRRGSLADETVTTLLDVANPASGAPLAAALHPFARMTHVPEAFRPRVADAARANLKAMIPERIFAVRALGRAAAAPNVLTAIVTDDAYTVAERVEAARGLGLSATATGGKSRAAAAEALAKLVSAKTGQFPLVVAAPEQHVFAALIDVLTNGPETAEKSLYALASLAVPADASEPTRLRYGALRCGAAGVLARSDFDAEVLASCAPAGSELADRARLKSLLAGSLTGPRRNAFLKLARTASIRVREAALEGAGAHAELGTALIPILNEALVSKKPGLVASAADLVQANPARFGVDPPAFAAALAEPWAEDLVETRGALLEAAVAMGHPRAKELATAACHDENATLRQKGQKALTTLGDAAPKCVGKPIAPAKEIDALLDTAPHVVLTVGTHKLGLRFDPDLAPVTATRLVALARAGFYKGIVIHRVVPAFVVQLGDPGGDGYGGSGKSLRCETSPIPFQPLDIGMALAGRDTGSSQIFVTLSRTPHLDGEYAHVGRADGDWDSIVEGDVVTDVSVEDTR